MTIERREASLVTSAMLGSASTGTCTVTWHRASRVRSGRDDGKRIRERPKGTGGEGEGVVSYKVRVQINCSRSGKVSSCKVVADYKNDDTSVRLVRTASTEKACEGLNMNEASWRWWWQ